MPFRYQTFTLLKIIIAFVIYTNKTNFSKLLSFQTLVKKQNYFEIKLRRAIFNTNSIRSVAMGGLHAWTVSVRWCGAHSNIRQAGKRVPNGKT